jgi:hypothetical protein
MKTLLGACFGVLALSLGACTAASEDASSDEQPLRFRPTDTELWAELSIALPTSTCLPGGACSRPLSTTPVVLVDGNTVALGAPLRLKPGPHTVSMNAATQTVTLEPRDKRTYVLAVARVTCTEAPRPAIPKTDFGTTVTLRNESCPTVARPSTAPPSTIGRVDINELVAYYSGSADPCQYALSKFTSMTCSMWMPTGVSPVSGIRIASGVCIPIEPTPIRTACDASQVGNFSWIRPRIVPTSVSRADQAYVPDTYAFAIGSETASVELTEGALRDVVLTLPVIGTVPPLFETVVTFDDPRELPSDAMLLPSIATTCSGRRGYTFGANATGSTTLTAFVDPTCVYTLTAGGRSVALTQSGTNAVNLKRLDVDDVVVTRENGTTFSARGTFELYFEGRRVVGPLATNMGVDVLPGTYELVIKYSTGDGPKTQRHVLTL